MWLESKEISEWAYEYCLLKKDKPEIRKYITDSMWSYYYCKDIKDRSEIRKNITDPYWAFKYCRDIKDDPEVRKYVDKGLENVLSILRGK